ncbi:MAG: GGDEF domain-containing protein [Cellvibrionaceae bacterium]
MCPVGESECVFLGEVQELRQRTEELSELVHTDPLTELSNRRYLMQSLEREIERTRRSRQATCVVMLDLDHFKSINDNHGHDIGDQALQQTARILKQAVRQLDIPCRYGGEEFVVILPATDLLTGVKVAERIRAMIEATPLPLQSDNSINDGLTMTASLGVDVVTFLSDDTPETVMKRADELLYQAKEEGRNRVCHGRSPLTREEDHVSQDEKDALFGLFGDADGS